MSPWIARLLGYIGIRIVDRLMDRRERDAQPAGNSVDTDIIGGAEVPREDGGMMHTEFLERIERDLIRDEGMRLMPYQDTVGKWTIGVGRNLTDRGISEREAMHLLRNDILIAESEVSGLACYRKTNEARRAVLVNMAFNLGITRLLGFRNMISALNEGDYDRASDEMLDSRWASQVGDRARRLSEQMRRGEWVA